MDSAAEGGDEVGIEVHSVVAGMDRVEEWRPVVAGHSSVNVITVCNHHPIGHLHSLGGAAGPCLCL